MFYFCLIVLKWQVVNELNLLRDPPQSGDFQVKNSIPAFMNCQMHSRKFMKLILDLHYKYSTRVRLTRIKIMKAKDKYVAEIMYFV